MWGWPKCASRSACERQRSTMLNVPGSFFDRWSVYFTHPSSPWEASITPRSSSSARSSCSGLTFATATTVTSSTRSGSQIAELAVDLFLDVERRLALPRAPLVPRDHELAHLLAQRLVAPGRRDGAVSAAYSASMSSGLSPRATRSADFASSIWRVSASASAS